MDLDIRQHLAKAKENKGLSRSQLSKWRVVKTSLLCLFRTCRLWSSAVSLRFNQGGSSGWNRRTNSTHWSGVVRPVRRSWATGERGWGVTVEAVDEEFTWWSFCHQGRGDELEINKRKKNSCSANLILSIRYWVLHVYALVYAKLVWIILLFLFIS